MRAEWIKAHQEWPQAQAKGYAWRTWEGNRKAEEKASEIATSSGLPELLLQRRKLEVEDAEKIHKVFGRVWSEYVKLTRRCLRKKGKRGYIKGSAIRDLGVRAAPPSRACTTC